LKKPTAGRGIGDAFASLGFTLPDFDWNPFGKFLFFILAIAILGFLLTAALYLK
jgi:hypothetical protein